MAKCPASRNARIEVCEVAFFVAAFFTREVAVLRQIIAGGTSPDAVFFKYLGELAGQ
jgi:hypothetical protein